MLWSGKSNAIKQNIWSSIYYLIECFFFFLLALLPHCVWPRWTETSGAADGWGEWVWWMGWGHPAGEVLYIRLNHTVHTRVISVVIKHYSHQWFSDPFLKVQNMSQNGRKEVNEWECCMLVEPRFADLSTVETTDAVNGFFHLVYGKSEDLITGI